MSKNYATINKQYHQNTIICYKGNFSGEDDWCKKVPIPDSCVEKIFGTSDLPFRLESYVVPTKYIKYFEKYMQ
jgi:hypothetical protein